MDESMGREAKPVQTGLKGEAIGDGAFNEQRHPTEYPVRDEMSVFA